MKRLVFLLGIVSRLAFSAASEGEWRVVPAPLVLESREVAIDLAHTIIRNFGEPEEGKIPVVDLLHIEGQKVSPYLEITLQLLRQARFEIRGSHVTRTQMEWAMREQRLQYPVAYGPNSFDIKDSLFGMPEGFTMFGRWFRGNAKDRGPQDPKIIRFAIQSTSIAALNLALMRYVILPYLTKQEVPVTKKFLIATGVTCVISYLYMHFWPEIMRFKEYGTKIIHDPLGAAGKQIRAVSNSKFFNLVTMVDETVVATITAAVLCALDEHTSGQPIWVTALKVLATGGAAAYSYMRFERSLAPDLELKELIDGNDPAQADAIQATIDKKRGWFYYVLYPLAINAANFLKHNAFLEMLPLVALGAGSSYWANRRDPQDRGEDVVERWSEYDPEIPCSAIISVRSVAARRP